MNQLDALIERMKRDDLDDLMAEVAEMAEGEDEDLPRRVLDLIDAVELFLDQR